LPDWYHRFADIPGISYTTPQQIERTALPGYDMVPTIFKPRFRTELGESLLWATGEDGGQSSISPVRAFTDRPPRKAPAAAWLSGIAEGLELPGEPTDYHFLIQGAIDELWPRHRREPDLIPDIERLCWLDISLVQARPDAASTDINGPLQFYQIQAFSVLMELFERRGDLAKALEIAEVAVKFDQCEDERQLLLWKLGARDTEPVRAPQEPTPQHPNGATPNQAPRNDGTISDWGFRRDVPDGPFGGHWSYWWDDWCQSRFNKLWSDEADEVADDLADKYWFHWPHLIGKALITRAPATYERILSFAQDQKRPGPAHIPENPHGIASEIAQWGAFGIVRKRRTWPEPSAAVCPTCSQSFWTGDVNPWAIQAFGPVRYCMNCALRVRNGNPQATWFENDIKALLRELQACLGRIPPLSYADGQLPHDGSPEERDRRIRTLMAMPGPETIKHVFGQSDWLGVLRAAGLVGETWRPSMGTWCHATDGHRCRSLLEKAMDDWFTANKLAHECEPRWPRHERFNPSAAKRADWLLPDGTYVECAGMMESKEYAQKIAEKQQLAKALGIPLIVVAPTDMHRLADIFSSHLQRDHVR
jgi:hypothetical protein